MPRLDAAINGDMASLTDECIQLSCALPVLSTIEAAETSNEIRQRNRPSASRAQGLSTRCNVVHSWGILPRAFRRLCAHDKVWCRKPGASPADALAHLCRAWQHPLNVVLWYLRCNRQFRRLLLLHLLLHLLVRSRNRRKAYRNTGPLERLGFLVQFSGKLAKPDAVRFRLKLRQPSGAASKVSLLLRQFLFVCWLLRHGPSISPDRAKQRYPKLRSANDDGDVGSNVARKPHPSRYYVLLWWRNHMSACRKLVKTFIGLSAAASAPNRRANVSNCSSVPTIASAPTGPSS